MTAKTQGTSKLAVSWNDMATTGAIRRGIRHQLRFVRAGASGRHRAQVSHRRKTGQRLDARVLRALPGSS